MKISLDLPDTATLARLDLTYFREVLVATLYYIGKLSEKEACLALGISRRAFEELLPRFGFSILYQSYELILYSRPFTRTQFFDRIVSCCIGIPNFGCGGFARNSTREGDQ